MSKSGIASHRGAAQASRRLPIAALLILGLVALVEHGAGRSLICGCGHVALWHGALDSGNSQQLLDWYSPSHLIHGLLFYAMLHLAAQRLPLSDRLIVALAIEGGWEMIENSPLIIDRYRTATIALGYQGDTILNSLADIGCMAFGFWLASRLAAPISILLGIALELLSLAVIRDNLTLNILMLVHPVVATGRWQGL